jgi:hypothetical protein
VLIAYPDIATLNSYNMKTENNKEIDAVALMRRLRRNVDKQLEGKSYDEQRRYLDEHTRHRSRKREEKPSHREAP